MSESEALPGLSPPLLRRQTSLERSLAEYKSTAESVIRELNQASSALILERPASLEGCIFVGHTNTDLDSIGSAIAGAELFDGVASRASDINSETEYALKRFGIALPPPFLEAAKHKPNAGVCLVDHNQITQMAAGVESKNIRGIIDHHGLQRGTVPTDGPIFILVRPWGSACTIIAHMFLQQRRIVSKKTAAILLCGVLSDTLNLESPTATSADRLIVPFLAQLAGITDTTSLAKELFKAKCKFVATMSAHQLLRGDMKIFAYLPAWARAIAFGVIETLEPEVALERREELMLELRALKKEGLEGSDGKREPVNLAFFAVVDTDKKRSTLLVCGSQERAVAEKVFGGTVNAQGLLDLGKRVSRKHDYEKPLRAVVESGWSPPPLSDDETKAVKEEKFGEIVLECSETRCCQLNRRFVTFGAVAKTIASVLHAQKAAKEHGSQDHKQGAADHAHR